MTDRNLPGKRTTIGADLAEVFPQAEPEEFTVNWRFPDLSKLAVHSMIAAGAGNFRCS